MAGVPNNQVEQLSLTRSNRRRGGKENFVVFSLQNKDFFPPLFLLFDL
jgi:hypothetical protein